MSILFLLIAIWGVVYIKFIYSKNQTFVYVNGIDLKNIKYEHQHDSNNEEHGYTDDQGKYHKDDDYHDQDQSQNQPREGDPDIPLDKDDIDRGIDKSYKKNLKSYYIWTHSWLEFMIALIYIIIFIVVDFCLFNEST